MSNKLEETIEIDASIIGDAFPSPEIKKIIWSEICRSSAVKKAIEDAISESPEVEAQMRKVMVATLKSKREPKIEVKATKIEVSGSMIEVAAKVVDKEIEMVITPQLQPEPDSKIEIKVEPQEIATEVVLSSATEVTKRPASEDPKSRKFYQKHLPPGENK